MYYKCTSCKSKFTDVKKPVWLCRCGKPLSVHYSWENINSNLTIKMDEYSLWRYASILPNISNPISLGEGFTPLLPLTSNLFVKNETVNPTGSFKDRGMSLAISMAKEQRVNDICLPSAGNAGISAAA